MFKSALAVIAAMLMSSAVASPAFDAGVEAYRQHRYSAAFDVWLPLAKEGDVEAQLRLARLYDHGEGTIKDDGKALYWYLRAAKQGNAGAEFVAAMRFRYGMGIPVDLQESAYWLKKAAAHAYVVSSPQGIVVDAQSLLATSYHKPTNEQDGIEEDLVLAYAWNCLAAARGNSDAKIKLQVIDAAAISPEQRAEALRLVARWHIGQGIEREAVPAAVESRTIAPLQSSLTLSEVRQKFPQHANLSDEDFIDVIHQVYYPNIERSKLASMLNHASNPSVAIAHFDMVGTGITWLLLGVGAISYFYMKRRYKNTDTSANVHLGGLVTLLILILGIFAPALILGSFKAAEEFTDNYSSLVALSEWATYRTASMLIIGVMGLFSIFASLRLRFVPHASSITTARIALIAWPITAIVIDYLMPRLVFPLPAQAAAIHPALNIFGSVLSAIAWLIYLSKSKHVAAIYSDTSPQKHGKKQHSGESEATTTREVHLSHLHSDQPFVGTEHGHYDVIGRELESGQLHNSTWLMAFAEADGDNDKAKARYIKLRLANLQAAPIAAPTVLKTELPDV